MAHPRMYQGCARRQAGTFESGIEPEQGSNAAIASGEAGPPTAFSPNEDPS
jgi:hypothetical protein